MKFYTNPHGVVFAYEEDGSQDAVIPADHVPITIAEADALRNPAPTPEAAKVARWEQIKAERDRRTLQGGYQVGGHWFHSDTFSRTQQLGLVLLGATLPVGVRWKTMSGEMVDMTPALAQQIFSAAAASDIAIFAVAETHGAAMVASADPGGYDFGVGWPPVFGE